MFLGFEAAERLLSEIDTISKSKRPTEDNRIMATVEFKESNEPECNIR